MVSRLVSRDSSSVVDDETARRHIVYKSPGSSKSGSAKKNESDGRNTNTSRFRNTDVFTLKLFYFNLQFKFRNFVYI